MRCQSFNRNIYPLFITASAQDRGIAPKMIFLPERNLVRMMIKAIVKKEEDENEEFFFLRFGLLENPNNYFSTPIEDD